MAQVIDEGTIFSGLDPTIQERILERRSIIFQGHETCLKELLAPLERVDLDGIISPDIILKLDKNEKITVGKELATLDETLEACYVPRTLDNFSEDKIVSHSRSFFKEVTGIVGATGSGKSTILKNIARAVKRDRPYTWVLQIDLNDYSKSLTEFKENNLKPVTVLNLLDSTLSDFERKIFSLQEKVVIILDGAEEACSDYKDVVLRLIDSCRKRNRGKNVSKPENFFFITQNCREITRDDTMFPDPKTYTDRSYDLKAFSVENQTEFLSKYWERKFGNKKKCEVYAEAVIKGKWFEGKDEPVGIPLQIRMVAGILENNFDVDLNSNWEGCYEFVSSRNTEPVLPKKITLTELYQLYIHKNCSNGAKSSLNTIRRDVAKINIQSDGYLHALALETVLGKRSRHYFKTKLDTIPDEKLVTFAIIKKVGNQLRFTHKTFAEYFVAECILDELKNPNEQLFKFFVNEILTDDKFKVVRLFLNTFIHQDLNTLTEAFKPIGLALKQKNFLGWYVSANEGLLGIVKLLFHSVGTPVDLNSVRVMCETPLHAAIKGLHEEIVELLVEKGAGVEVTDNDDRTPLHLAAQIGSLSMVKFLVERGADIRCKDRVGRSVLREAVACGRLEIIKYLLERGADINSRCRYGGSALHDAAKKGDLSIVRYLVEKGAKVNSTGRRSGTVLSKAIESDSLEIVKYLVGKGADFTGTVLHIPHRNLDITKFFIEKGVDVNDGDERGETVLQKAITWDCTLEFIQFLAESGADIHPRSTYQCPPPLTVAIARKRLDIVRYLMEKGARFDDCANQTELIFTAVKENKLDILKYLSERGVSFNVRNKKGFSPIHLAVATKNVDIVRLLIENGTDVNRATLERAVASCGLDIVKLLVENCALTGVHFNGLKLTGHLDTVKYLIETGYTFDNVQDVGGNVELLRYLLDKNIKLDEASIFFKAAERGDLSIVKALTGVDVNCTDREGRTALHKAAGYNKVHIVRYLLGRGAQPNQECWYRRTPIHEAIIMGHLDAVKLLVNGVDVNAPNKRGSYLLHSAMNSLEMLEFLVEQGAQIKRIGTPSYETLKSSPMEIIEFFTEKKFGCNLKELVQRSLYSDVPENTEIVDAVLSQTSIVKYLIENGLELSAEVINSRQLLCSATCEGNFELVKKLIELGGDVNCKFDIEHTVLFLVLLLHRNNFNIVQFLLESGADVTDKYDYGRSLLHLAFGWNNLDICKLLVDNGADINAKDDSGETVLYLAVQSSFAKTKYLFEKGVKTSPSNILHEAITTKHSDLDTVKFLIDNGLDVNGKDGTGRTPLIRAVESNDLDAVKLLVEKGAKLNDVSDTTLLHEALAQKDASIVKYLAKMGLNLNAKTDSGATLLHQAAFKDDVQLVKLLVGTEADVSAVDKKGRSVLHEAVTKTCNMEIVKVLIEKGADVNAKDRNGCSALLEASSTKNLALIRYLMGQGALIDNERGRTVLHESARSGSVDTLKFFVENGADVNATDKEGLTPLHEACQRCELDLRTSFDTSLAVKLLLENGAKVNVKARNGRTPLHEAALTRNFNVVKLLVEHGADPNAKDEYGRNPLFDAVTAHQMIYEPDKELKIIECLIESGADFLCRADNSHTLLHKASAECRDNVVEFLLKMGVDVNIKTRDGQTALHQAAKRGWLSGVKLLVDAGVDVEAKTVKGRTALDEATVSGYTAIVKFLKTGVHGTTDDDEL